MCCLPGVLSSPRFAIDAVFSVTLSEPYFNEGAQRFATQQIFSLFIGLILKLKIICSTCNAGTSEEYKSPPALCQCVKRQELGTVSDAVGALGTRARPFLCHQREAAVVWTNTGRQGALRSSSAGSVRVGFSVRNCLLDVGVSARWTLPRG